MAIMPVRKRPGLYYNTDTGKFFSLVEYHDGDMYDTVAQASGSISSGNELNLFRDLTNKNRLDSNFETPRRISKGQEMLVKRVWAEIPQVYGNTIVAGDDLRKVAYGGYLEVKINRDRIAEGPLYFWPSGRGVTGSVTDNARSALTLGVPSTAAVRGLEKTHEITSEHDLDGSVKFFDRSWDAANMASISSRVHVRVGVGGLIRSAATK